MAVGVLSAAWWLPLEASAQDVVVDVDLTTVVRGPEGSEHLLATQDVPDALRGHSCSVRAVSHNQHSAHPDNDLVVASNGVAAVLRDVERAPFALTVATGPLTLGPEVSVTLVMGPDEVFSAGIVVELRCRAVETTTTTRPETSTTDTTAPDTTTTVPATTTSTSSPTTTDTPSTTVPEETSTTGPAETTTTSMGDTTTTSGQTSTTGGSTSTTTPPQATSTVSTTPSTLPFTGVGRNGAALAATALAAGAAVLMLARRRRTLLEGERGTYIETTIEGVRVRFLRPGD
jgi:hypothetical protein